MLFLVTGRSGVGKSTLAKEFAKQMNCKYVNIDEIGHASLEDSMILNKIIAIYGDDILENGKLNRRKLGEKVFNKKDEKYKEFCEATFPFIEKKMNENFCKNRNVVFDWQLLPLTKFWNKNNTVKILIQTDDEKERYKNLYIRDNVSIDYLKRREALGLNFNPKEMDFVVNNEYTNMIFVHAKNIADKIKQQENLLVK